MGGLKDFVYSLTYQAHMEKNSRIFGVMVFVVGALLIWFGAKEVVRYIYVAGKLYSTVPGRITGYDKKVRVDIRATQTDYFPIMEFEYNGQFYKVVGKKALGESTISALMEASRNGNAEIRIPKGQPEDAMPDYEMNRHKKLVNGIQVLLIGLAFAAAGLVFALT